MKQINHNACHAPASCGSSELGERDPGGACCPQHNVFVVQCRHGELPRDWGVLAGVGVPDNIEWCPWN